MHKHTQHIQIHSHINTTCINRIMYTVHTHAQAHTHHSQDEHQMCSIPKVPLLSDRPLVPLLLRAGSGHQHNHLDWDNATREQQLDLGSNKRLLSTHSSLARRAWDSNVIEASLMGTSWSLLEMEMAALPTSKAGVLSITVLEVLCGMK